MIKAICFDLDGVFFTSDSWKKVRSKLAINTSEEKSLEVLNKSSEMMSFKSGTLSEVEYWDYVNKELKLSYSVSDYLKIISDSYSVDESVYKSVLDFKSRGYLTCICSNNFPTRINALNEKFDFLKDFDTVVLSYKEGVLKPDRRIFEKLVEKSKVLPIEIAYSDDSVEKLSGANEIGISTFVYTDYDSFIATLKTLGVE